MPLILLVIVIGTLWGGDCIPVDTKNIFYSISLSIKEILRVILPFIIFTFVLRSLLSLGRGTISFVLLLIPMIIASNFLSTCLAYLMGGHWLTVTCFACKIFQNLPGLSPLWQLDCGWPIKNEWALLGGLITGIIGAVLKLNWLEQLSMKLLKIVESFLKHLFVPLLPLFIFGFTLNLQHSGALQQIISGYLPVLINVSVLCFGYILLLYGVLQKFNLKQWRSTVGHMMPAVLTGLTTMSSAAAMPLTLMGVTKNTNDPATAQTVVPATVNIHLMGDCFAIPIFALALLLSFNQPLPDFSSFLVFAYYFVLAKFAVAAIPGGGIIVMLPILEHHLGFSPEMLSLITALYILFDPIITGANVLGNGAFAQMFSYLYRSRKSKILIK